MDTQTPFNHKLFFIAFCILLLLCLGFILLRGRSSAPSTPRGGTQTITFAPKEKGSMTVHSSQSTVHSGESITISVSASSDGKPVVGYDVVLTYDEKLVRYVSAKSLVSDFELLPGKATPGRVPLTVIKSLSSQTPTVLTNTPVIQAEFTTLANGAAFFNLEFTPGSTTDSNLITEDAASRDILGSVQGTTVTIGGAQKQTISLQKGQPQTVGKVTLTLTTLEVPSESCRDCMTKVVVSATKGGATKDLTFTDGGITGRTSGPQTAYEYTFTLSSYDTRSVSLSYE